MIYGTMELRHEQQYRGRFAYPSNAIFHVITTSSVVGKAPFISGIHVPAVRVATMATYEGRFAMPNLCGVYSIRNTRNQKRYIGSSLNVTKRWKQHLSDLKLGKHHSGHLQGAWNKYGEHAFCFEMIAQCGRDELVNLEQHWIDAYRTYDDRFGYNIAPTAYSQRGIKRSDETKARISVATREVMTRPGVRERLSQVAKARRASPETRAKIAAANIGRVLSNKARAALHASNTGKKLSNATKAKLSASHTGMKHTAESKQRMSIAQRKSLARPEVRAKIVEKAIGRKASNETKEKMSLVQRGENNPHSKLTDDDVREIRRLLKTGMKQPEIASRFGVASTIISRIKTGTIWTHVV